jgi:outer membrane protein, heavy metal efflux system
MSMRGDRWRRAVLLLGLACLAAPGCRYGTEYCIDQRLAQLGAEPLDALASDGGVSEPAPAAANSPPAELPAIPGSQPAVPTTGQGSLIDAADSAAPAAAGDSVPPRLRFAIPRELPGADAPPLRLPPLDPNRPLAERRAQVADIFQTLPSLPAELVFPLESGETALALADLQRTALDNSPVLREAAARVDAARGEAIQAGACPNPVVGYEADTVNTGETSGYQGGFITQTFITAGKLTLAQNAALMDVQAAELALRRAQISVASDVRSQYFAVLIAQQRVQYARAFAKLSEEAYRAHTELVVGGEAAAYEPLQLRVFALQARNAVTVAENQHLASWRQLAAALGLPDMPPGLLRGSGDAALPEVSYEAALDYLLGHHTDLIIAQTQIDKAAYNLKLQRVTPIPDVGVYTAVQYDDTTMLNNTTYNLQVSVPLPLLNRNRGNIIAGEAEVVRARQNWNTTRNTLTATLADAYNRYLSNRKIAETYRNEILRDQVRIYRGIYDRYRQAGDSVDFSQVVIAQQQLRQSINEYLEALTGQWQAFVDFAEVLQVDELFQVEAIIQGSGETPEQP